jgi:signal peptidase II
VSWNRPTLKHFGVLALVVIVLDQLSKLAIVLRFELPGGNDSIVIIPRLLQFIYQTNTGAAFSFFRDHPGVLKVFATLVAVGLLIWSWRLAPQELSFRWPLGLILGGAVGNLIDRYRLGHVIDFIDAHWDERYHFPTFNVADSAICIGMGLLIWLSFSLRTHE